MNNIKYYMLFLLLLISKGYTAQQSDLTITFGKFNSAASFAINSKGIIYVTDIGSNEIIQLDTLGNVIRSIGGYGWDSYSFDEPTDIFANTLNVYVADKNNDRIQIYDKDLNFISSFTTKNAEIESYSFRYPTSVGIFTQGDFFVLDSDNTRILKFNSRGKFQTEIGGFNSGSYVLTQPKKLSITDNGEIFVIEQNNIVVFDQFGNFLSKTNLDFEPDNINYSFGSITIVSENQIAHKKKNGSVINTPFQIIKPNITNDIEDALIFNSKLYVLTNKNIYIIRLTD